MQAVEVQAGAARRFRFELYHATTGAPLGGLTEASAGLAAEYIRADDTAWTAINLADAGVVFAEVGGAGSGLYDFTGPAAAYASEAGVGYVDVRFRGAANLLTETVRVYLRGYDPTVALAPETVASATSTQLLADLAGAPGTAARREMAAEHIGLPQRLATTPTGVGTEVIDVQVDKGAGFVSVGTMTFVNGVVREQT